MKNTLKRDVKIFGDKAEYIAKYDVTDGSWVLEIIYRKSAVLLFTERGVIRTFKSLDAVSNLLADCGVTKFSTICYKK